MRTRSKSQTEATAYHEAGHAVIAYFLGYKPEFVTIIPTVDSAGHIITPIPCTGFSLISTTWVRRDFALRAQ